MPLSAVLRNPHLPTVFEHRTHRALWQPTGADVLAKGHKQTVYLHPVFLRKSLLQHAPRCIGCRSADESPAVGDAVNMHIDADLGGATGNAQSQIRALRSDAPK